MADSGGMGGTDTRSRLRLHLGCGSVTPQGWVNVDRAFGARLAKLGPVHDLARNLGLLRHDWSPEIRVHDLRQRFPWSDGSAEAIYCANTLEHLTRREGEYFLFECARVLAPGGVLRIVVPDLTAMLADYEKGVFPSTEFVERLGLDCSRPLDGPIARRLARLTRSPRRCLYDAEGLLDAMFGVGIEARVHAPGLSRIEDLDRLERGDGEGSLIVEGVRSDPSEL